MITTEEEYRAAMARIDEIFDAEDGTPESEELITLVCAVIDWEDGHYSWEDFDDTDF